MKIVDDMLTAMDRGHAVTVIGLQMSSAFDAICHHTLIDRLQSDRRHRYLSAVDHILPL